MLFRSQLSPSPVAVGPLGNEVNVYKITSDVASAGATLYKDDWATANPEAILGNAVVENPFLSGNSGIWRPYKSYSYVGERANNASLDNNTTTTSNPKIFDDGLMSDVPL